MKRGVAMLAVLALALLLLLPLLHFGGLLAAGTMRTGLFAATLLWFASAPFWMRR